MPFQLDHLVLSTPLEVTTHHEGDEIVFRVARTGTFTVLHPGRLVRDVMAIVTHSYRNPDLPEEPELPQPLEGEGPRQPVRPSQTPDPRPVVNEDHLQVTLTIFTPDAKVFTAEEITLADLRRFRDARGVPFGEWSYTLGGMSRRYRLNDAIFESVSPEPGSLELRVVERVASESAPPLLTNTVLDGSRQTFRFDLFRIGRFVAEITTGAAWKGTTRLLDPDGVQVAGTSAKTLEYQVDLVAIGKSRDRDGRPREWSLQVSPQGGVVVGSPMVSATVYGSSRITADTLHRRILKLIGTNGRFIHLYGNNERGAAKAKLMIEDPAAAEAIDMHRLLEKRLKQKWNPPPLDVTDVNAGEHYTLFQRNESLPFDTQLDVSTLQVTAINATVGEARQIGPGVPGVRLQVDVAGEARVKYVHPDTGVTATVGTARVPGGRTGMEVGISIGEDGVPELAAWVPDDLFDADVDATLVAGLALVPILGIPAAVAAVTLTEHLEGIFKEQARREVQEFFTDPLLAPLLLMTIIGAHVTYTSIRLDGNDIVFEYVAPLEPQAKPGPDYVGVIGRQMVLMGTGSTQMVPRSLGDTWAADNLKSKIDHIVVVIMENRSYDHVLGFRARDPVNEPSDGLTPAVVDAIQAAEPAEGHAAYVVRNFASAGFPPNEAQKMTRLPKKVAHGHVDAKEQLAVRIATQDGREINGPQGFVESFRPRARVDNPDTPEDETEGVVPNDVLGYYDADQLPMYDYLARNFGYCDRFFCSHPGPTLPNRMYSLTGDVQHDRLGVPVLENKHGEVFQLSRAETIYDRLTKLGVSWRVYESEPSVTMLRMFARYATNNTDIVPIANLRDDALYERLPSFSFVEPAMHHHPPNDDHPPADMWRGQKFIRDVYEWLRDAPTWERTLLIVTYDEHGGLYDHVVPPIADLLEPARESGGVIGVTGTVTTEEPEPDQPVGGGGGGFGGRFRAESPLGDDGPLVSGGHEPPPPPPPPARVEIPYGVRVPTFLVSPSIPPGRLAADGMTFDFCSILKTVLARFAGDERPFLSDRVDASQSFEPLLTESSSRYVDEPVPEISELPVELPRIAEDESAIDTSHLTRKQLREGDVESHELMGRLARMLGR